MVLFCQQFFIRFALMLQLCSPIGKVLWCCWIFIRFRIIFPQKRSGQPTSLFFVFVMKIFPPSHSSVTSLSSSVTPSAFTIPTGSVSFGEKCFSLLLALLKITFLLVVSFSIFISPSILRRRAMPAFLFFAFQPVHCSLQKLRPAQIFLFSVRLDSVKKLKFHFHREFLIVLGIVPLFYSGACMRFSFLLLFHTGPIIPPVFSLFSHCLGFAPRAAYCFFRFLAASTMITMFNIIDIISGQIPMFLPPSLDSELHALSPKACAQRENSPSCLRLTMSRFWVILFVRRGLIPSHPLPFKQFIY